MKTFPSFSQLISCTLILLFCSHTYSQLADKGPVYNRVSDTLKLKTFVSHHLDLAREEVTKLKETNGQHTFENTYRPYKAAQYHFQTAALVPLTMKDLHPDPAYREVAGRLGMEASGQGTLNYDIEIYRALAAIDPSTLDSGAQYQLDRLLKKYQREGILLNEEQQAKLQAINGEIFRLTVQFMENLNTNDSSIYISADSLQGVPEDLLANLPRSEDGRISVNLNPSVSMPVIMYAKNEETRKKVNKAIMNRAYPENYVLLDSVRLLRQDLADLLGYKNYPALKLEDMMLQTPEQVSRLLDEAAASVAEEVKKEHEALLKVKQRENPERKDGLFYDYFYYQDKLKKEEYQFDAMAMREYLPYNHVKEGVLNVYSRMYELDFVPLDAGLWDSTVNGYEVIKDDNLIGRIYLDMHPRNGKTPGNRQTNLSFGNGQLPEILLVCNFPQPTSNSPGLMDIENVKTFFHEFGHLMHYLFYGQQAVPGAYEEDFAEAPSQLFEYWATNKGILKSFARHHETGEVIPDELLEQYFQAESFGRATEINALIGNAYSGLELYLYSPQEKSIDEVMQESFRKYQVMEYPEDVHLAANFHHLVHMGPRFYTYLISGIIARDLFSAFDAHDLTESRVGERYRATLLSPTGTKSSMELVEDFLGRPYTYDAWKTWVAKQ